MIFPKVVYAHTLGEVGNLGRVLLRVSSVTVLPIFIEIGSYLTRKKKKIPHRPRSVARELIPCRHFEPARVKPN